MTTYISHRSLTAFGNYNGRESAMSNGYGMNSYRMNNTYQTYQNTGGDQTTGFGGGPPDPDRPNPFVSGGSVSEEASSVVQSFLKESVLRESCMKQVI